MSLPLKKNGWSPIRWWFEERHWERAVRNARAALKAVEGLPVGNDPKHQNDPETRSGGTG